MKRIIITLAIIGLASVGWAQFVDIGNPQHYGKINIPKAYKQIDANFATITGGTAEVALDDGQIWVGDATDKQAAVAVSGDVTIANDGAVTIADEAVTLAKMDDIATLSVIGRSTAGAGVPEALSAATDHFVLRRSGAALGFGLVGDDNVDPTANIAVAVTRVNDLIDYLSDGLWVVGDLANSSTPNKFQTEAAAAYSIGGISYVRTATDGLEFSQADTINTGGATNTFYGSWVIQVNASGTISTLAATGQGAPVDMDYESASEALTAAQAITLTAANAALGYLVLEYDATTETGDEGGTWTANASDLTTNATATYTDGDVKSLPAKIE